MKKLTILTAVAALAAFGWASDVDAGFFTEDGTVSCTRTANGGDFLDDEYTIFWEGTDGADSYAVTFECSDAGKPSRAQKVTVPDSCVSSFCQSELFFVDEFNGVNGIKAGWVCHGWVKPLADDHKNSSNPNNPNRHELGHDECDFDLGESP